MTSTDADGYYSFEIVPGSYLLWTDDRAYFGEFPPHFYPGTTDRSQAEAVELRAAETLTRDVELRSAFSNERASTALDTGDRDSVAQAYRDRFQRHFDLTAPLPTAQEIRDCQAGVGDQAEETATLEALNFVRSLAGLPHVSWDREISAKTRDVALLMQLNDRLSPYPSPPEEWRCWDLEKYGQAHAAIQSRRVGALAVVDGLAARDDPHFNKRPDLVVNRDYILDPQLETFGYGSYRNVSALYPGPPVYAYESGRTTVTPRFVNWPAAGWFPTQLTPYDRWSFDAPHMSYNFEQAKVKVTRLGAKPQTFTPQTHVASASHPLVWEMPSVPGVIGSETAEYRVTISNMRYRGRYQPDHTYTVKIFDPRLSITATSRASLDGFPRVGSVLTAKPPAWSVEGTASHYQWYRGSDRIHGATKPSYRLTAGDVGHRMTVEVTGTKLYCFNGESLSQPSARVAKKTATSRLSGKVSGRTVKLSFSVSSDGEPAITGRARLKEGRKTVKKLTVTSGRATAKLTKVKRGNHTYTVSWTGNARVAGTSAAAKVKVK